MWISCDFPSGARFKYCITRYNDKLDFAFSNDEKECNTQMKIFTEWLKHNKKMSYGNLFKELKTLCEGCNTGKDLITKMK
jgi:hypothetical protein